VIRVARVARRGRGRGRGGGVAHGSRGNARRSREPRAL